MSQPHVTLDPDPLHVAELEQLDRRRRELLAEIRERLESLDPDPLHVAERELEAWEAGYAAALDGQGWRVAGLVLAALSGAVVGAALMYGIVTAAPRPAQTTERDDLSALASARLSGAPLDPASVPAAVTGDVRPVGAPPPSSALPEPSSITGIASYVGSFLGDRYLALPEGRGVRVRICAADRCIVRTSTDAGPDLAMQRAGRIADVSFVDFAALCRCDPPDVGLLRVTVTRLDPGVTPPPTTTGDER